MSKSKTLTLAQLGVFTGLIILLTFTPLGYISFGVVSATTIHIPVIIGAVVLGWKFGLILGGVMGVFSLIRAVAMPNSILDPLFWNPLVSVFPRLLIGFVAALAFLGLMKAFHGKRQALAIGLSAAAGTLVNTIFVLGMLTLLYSGQMQEMTGGNALMFILLSILSWNGLLEIGSAVILSIPICSALLKMQKRMINE